MNELDILKKLSAAADRREVPRVDVSQRVLAALSAPEEASDHAWEWIAALSTAAVIPVAILSYEIVSGWMDPLSGLFIGLGWILS